MGSNGVPAAVTPEFESGDHPVAVMSEMMAVRMPYEPDLADGFHAAGANEGELSRVALLRLAILACFTWALLKFCSYIRLSDIRNVEAEDVKQLSTPNLA